MKGPEVSRRLSRKKLPFLRESLFVLQRSDRSLLFHWFRIGTGQYNYNSTNGSRSGGRRTHLRLRENHGTALRPFGG